LSEIENVLLTALIIFSCNMEMIDAAPLETIVDEDEEGDSDIEID